MRTLVATLVLMAASASASLAADPVMAGATVDRDSIHVGDPMHLSVVVQAEAGYQVTDPGVPRVFGPFEILETLPAQQDPTRGGATRIVFHYRITTFALGQLTIPAFEVKYTGPQGAGVVRTNDVPVRVETLFAPGAAPTDIRPLAPQLSLPGALMPALAHAAALAEAVLIALFLAIWVIRRMRRPEPLALPEPHLRPIQDALAELMRIADLRLPEQGRLQEHYELAAASLRRYVRARFGLSAAERTPRELRADLERAGADRQQIAIIYQVLHEAEVARYPRLAPYPAHAREALRSALEVMRRAAADEEYLLDHAAAGQTP